MVCEWVQSERGVPAAVRWDSLANLSATVNLHSAIKRVRWCICGPVVIKTERLRVTDRTSCV